MTRTVVVTGACGGLGRVVVRRLLAQTDLHVLGLDKRNWVLDKPDRFEFRRVDLRRGAAEDVLRTVRPWGLVHLAFVQDQSVSRGRRHEVNVEGTQRLLEWSLRYGVERAVLASRATVYGAQPDNPSLISEDMPLRLGARYTTLSDLVEFDHLVRSFLWEHKTPAIVLLRPVYMVGPNIREGMLHRYLQRNPVPTALGFDPMLQFIHEDDVAGAVHAALVGQERGIFNVAGPGAVPLSVLLRETGRRALPIPHPLLGIGDRLAFRLGVSKLPPEAIDFVRFPCVVDGSRFERTFGFGCAHDLRRTLDAVRESATLLA